MVNNFQPYLTAAAEKQYRRLYEEAEASGGVGGIHPNALRFRLVDEAISTIIPNGPVNSRFALPGRLNGIYRFRKGNIRIGYVIRPQDAQISIVYISCNPRSITERQDIQAVVASILASGDKTLLKTLGVDEELVAPFRRLGS